MRRPTDANVTPACKGNAIVLESVAAPDGPTSIADTLNSIMDVVTQGARASDSTFSVKDLLAYAQVYPSISSHAAIEFFDRWSHAKVKANEIEEIQGCYEHSVFKCVRPYFK
jgi:hypothetical protein